MPPALSNIASANRWLLAVAAPKEVESILAGLGYDSSATSTSIAWRAWPINKVLDLVVTGIGKANAAAALARSFDAARHRGIINLGIAGALPMTGAKAVLQIGDVVEADRCSYADEGSSNPAPEGFITIAQMGFGPLADICGSGNGIDQMSLPCTPLFADTSTPFPLHRGGVATVSTCSGQDALAHEIARRTGAIAEDMEAAALAFTAARLSPGIHFSVLKVISNTTGDRATQSWDLRRAFARLRDVSAALSETLGR